MLQKLSLGLLLIVSASYGASLVEFSGNAIELKDSGKSMTDTGRVVKILSNATVVKGKEKFDLKLTGAGIRWKTVAIMDVNVYAAANYIDSNSKINALNPMESISASKGKVMNLTFFRSLTAKEIGEALKIALEKNGVDLNAPHLKNFFGQFDFSVSPGESMMLIGTKLPTGDEELVLEAPGKVIKGQGKNMATDVWKAYLGTPVDKGLEDLKSKLIGN
ncbi:MAG: chalcone isomerase family protein [Pseudomonadota bacterium]